MGILITNSVPMRPFPSIPIVQQDFQEYEKYLTIFFKSVTSEEISNPSVL